MVRKKTLREFCSSVDSMAAHCLYRTSRSRKFFRSMPTTEVILTDNVPGLGAEADVVKVRCGYARNYLLPHGKAYEVTPAALRQLDNLKKKRAEREARELNEGEELARRIGKL